MQQVAVRRMDLDDLKPRLEGAAGRGGEGGDHPPDARLIERPRAADRLREGSGLGATTVQPPWPSLQPGSTFPGDTAARLATGVGELDAGDGPLRLTKRTMRASGST